MPIYEYQCSECGSFTAVRPMSQYRDPHPCPACGAGSPRVTLSAPALSGLPVASRQAHAINERSAHAPRSSSAEEKARHGPGCGCCGGGRQGRVAKSNDGSKGFPDKRPWMISH
jgi:putative FmdB family regulatory protein